MMIRRCRFDTGSATVSETPGQFYRLLAREDVRFGQPIRRVWRLTTHRRARLTRQCRLAHTREASIHFAPTPACYIITVGLLM
eukprot:298413-Prorocentrum_minimum.AAC.1